MGSGGARLIRTLMPSLLIFALGPMGLREPPAPLPLDLRHAVRQRLIKTVGRLENCRKWKNQGCLKYAAQPGARRGPSGYAKFHFAEDGDVALAAWFDDHACLSVGQMLHIYNARDGYVERVLAMAQVPGDVVLGEGCE